MSDASSPGSGLPPGQSVGPASGSKTAEEHAAPGSPGRPERDRVAGPEATSSVDRRSFFRVFSRQTVTTVVQVAGMAGAVHRGATAAMVEAVSVGMGNPAGTAARSARERTGRERAVPVVGESGESNQREEAMSTHDSDAPPFRSPYRNAEGTMYLLDQRLLPERFEEIPCRRAADVAFQMRSLAVNGGPLLGQVAAYGLALTAREAQDWPSSRRLAELRRASQLLTYARPAAHPVRAALARLERCAAQISAVEGANGKAIAEALMIEADAIATQAAIDHAAIAQAAATLLAPREGMPLSVLLVGDPGLLTTGQVGTGVTALSLLAQAGVEMRVFVAEGGPRLEGARLASWELGLAGIDHTVVGDSALGWLMSGQPLDAVLMGAEWIAANGDVVAMIGSRTAAELAALGLNNGTPTPVYVLAPSVTLGPEPFAASSIPSENRPGRELAVKYGVANQRGTNAVNPAVEVVPNARVTAIVSERAVHRPPFEASLHVAADTAA